MSIYDKMTLKELMAHQGELEKKMETFKAANREQALKAISLKTTAAMELIRECEQLAQLNQVEFSFDVSYGMGGTYVEGDGDRIENGEWGWVSSSNNC